MKMRKRCARCQHKEADGSSAFDGRPLFKCTKCGHLWTEGRKPMISDKKRKRK